MKTLIITIKTQELPNSNSALNNSLSSNCVERSYSYCTIPDYDNYEVPSAYDKFAADYTMQDDFMYRLAISG